MGLTTTPAGLSAGTPQNTSNKVYTLFPNSNGTGYYFQKPSGDPSGTGPLEMYVTQNCSLTLNLASSVNGQFANPPVQFNSVDPAGYSPATTRYTNLAENSTTSITFDASYFANGPAGHTDIFNIYIVVNGQSVTIDPDVKNPGDDPPH